ncbi:MAG: UvrD-helicase domain-containing protein [Clostridia bacterium]|nr:UvrD-helicase domain-containing protein [Clostridia bacterium]
MDLTTSQINAINARCGDMIVSAGAGSGKTTVLTLRLADRILKGASVNDFLVVTFMNAAASDMRSKLYKLLTEESARDPANKHLQNQLYLLGEANICTISSYCLSLVRENFAALGISPRVRVMDETEAAMLLRREADSLVSDLYESGGEEFELLVNVFSGDKDDSPLIDKMINVYGKLRAMPEWSGMLLSCAEELRADAKICKENGFFACGTGKELQTRITARLEELASDSGELLAYAAANASEDKYLAPVAAFDDAVHAVLSAAYAGYSAFRESFADFESAPMLARSGCPAEARGFVTAEKKRITSVVRKLRERYCRGSDSFVAESFSQCASVVDSVRAFIESLDERYEAAKREANALDYSDFELKALSLLQVKGENGEYLPSELCLRKRKLFKEVLIDEYQDVNPVQDRIFTLLSGGNSRFMVGDVKQSIYRFRNAYPDIFLSYKKNYPDYAQDSPRARIFLRENFRCSDCIIKFVNRLFDTVTAGTPFRPEYDGEWLIHKSEKPEIPRPVVIAVAEKVRGKADLAKRAEAEFIAGEIQRLVREECDSEGNPLHYGDIAVMLSAMKGFSIEYEKAFRKYKVPYRSASNESFLENPVVSLAVSAMKAIDDPTDDISLCALMRSPVCNFTSGELYRIRAFRRDTAFWNAVAACALPRRKKQKSGAFTAKKRPGGASLCAKCRRFVRTLSEWRHAAEGVPCGEFLKSFFVSSGLLRIADSESRKKSLLLLYDYALRCESGSGRSLSGFLDYLKEFASGGRTLTDVASAGDGDSVAFITVHKSKGLEYKVCFVAGTGKKFKFGDSADSITLLRRRGLFFRLRDRKTLTSYDPLCSVLARDTERDLAFGEELRKLYVALTRARERLYVTGAIESSRRERVITPASAQNWLELVLYCASQGETSFFDVRDIRPAEGEAGYIPASSREQIIPTEEMLAAASYVYPYSAAADTARKISVSELREGLNEPEGAKRLIVPASRVGAKPAFAEEYAATAADKGTANHVFMQFCDFARVEQNGVSAEADRLAEAKLISPQQRELIDPATVDRFFQSKLYREMRGAKKIYREKRFSVRDNIFGPEEPVLVQGVIDCFYENPDGSYTVVDYKTDRGTDAALLAQRHRVQLECYRRAVESMTGKKVSRTVIYSFALGAEAEI